LKKLHLGVEFAIRQGICITHALKQKEGQIKDPKFQRDGNLQIHLLKMIKASRVKISILRVVYLY